uniref:Uncharacterized protein MANES_12G025900 n=1 Tax=Rhizophora mucronata TaxID=61149 RepID=A0A2P2MD95_RHIMU
MRGPYREALLVTVNRHIPNITSTNFHENINMIAAKKTILRPKGARTYTRVRPSILDKDSGKGPVRLLLFRRLNWSKKKE